MAKEAKISNDGREIEKKEEQKKKIKQQEKRKANDRERNTESE